MGSSHKFRFKIKKMPMNQPYNPLSLKGKNILITGAASGIGRATSIILSKLGASLLLLDINESGLSETKSYCQTKVTTITVDVTNVEELKEKVLYAVRCFGKLNGIAHIAGKPSIVPLKAITQKVCLDVFQINSYAAIELSKLFINRNVYAGEKGSIVFISSIYALVGSSANIAYAMTKAALHGATKSLSIELAPKNIRVNCIAPGFVKTEMMAENEQLFNEEYTNTITKMHPLGLGQPEDIANAIAFLLSDASKWITGSIISVDGGFTAQ